tara:strand:+ start:145 stop:411 length:267 start_codon:yes stop_codon:yes gene_type:complete
MLEKRERRLFRCTKAELVDTILEYESKLKDMELDDMLVTVNKKGHLEMAKEADKALLRFNKKLKKYKEGDYDFDKIFKSKGKKTSKLR